MRRIVNQTLSQSVPPSVVTGVIGYTKLLVGFLIERARDVQEQNAAAAAAYPSPPSRPQSSKTAGNSQSLGNSTQDTALPSSFESSATLTHDGPFSSGTSNAHQDVDSDTDRPPELNHNDIFGTASSPSQPSKREVTPGLPTNGLKSLPSLSQQTPNAPGDLPMLSPSGSSRFALSLSPKIEKQGNKRKPAYLGPLLPDDFREAYRRHKRNGESAGIGQGGMSLMGIGVQGTFAGSRGRGKRLFG